MPNHQYGLPALDVGEDPIREIRLPAIRTTICKLMTRMSRRVRRCFLTVIGLVAIGITACNRQQVSGWKKLAEIRDSSGNRYVVAQQHYAWVEGWRISFSLVGADRKIYGSVLEME